MISSPSINPALMGEVGPLNLQNQNPKELGQQFDAILWRNFLTSALKPAKGQSGLLKGTGPGADLQFNLVVDTLAQAMAQGQSLGFDQLLNSSNEEANASHE